MVTRRNFLLSSAATVAAAGIAAVAGLPATSTMPVIARVFPARANFMLDLFEYHERTVRAVTGIHPMLLGIQWTPEEQATLASRPVEPTAIPRLPPLTRGAK